MRAYYSSVVTWLADFSKLLALIVMFVICSIRSEARAPALGTPSAVIGTINFCPSKLWSIKQMPSCHRIAASQDDITLASNALAALNTLVKSDKFKAAVLAVNFDPAQMKTCPNNLCGAQMTKQQIYDLIVASAPQKINVTYYLHHWPDAGNQGFEDPNGVKTVFANDGKVRRDQGFLASLMLHEWMHILGFHHDDSNTACRSVPYEMNRVYETVAPQLGLPPSVSPCAAANQ
jgi:hypothetical protein